jgi:hypothetical protein
LSGKLKNSKNKNVSIVIRKLQGEILVKFRNFSETTMDGAGNADKKPGERTRRDQRSSKKGSAVSCEALMLQGNVLYFWFYGHGAGGFGNL